MLSPIVLYFWFNIFPSVSMISTTFIEKSYAVNECIRTHTSEEVLLSLSLKNAFTYNPPVCTCALFFKSNYFFPSKYLIIYQLFTV